MIEKINRYGVKSELVDRVEEYDSVVGRYTKYLTKLVIVDRLDGKDIISVDTRNNDVNGHIVEELIRILNYEVVL